MTNFKETIVNWSRSKWADRIFWTLIIAAMVGFVLFKFEFLYIGGMVTVIFWQGMDVIKKQKDIVIQNNRLIYIILSDYNTVFLYIWILIIISEVEMLHLIDLNFLWSFIVAIIILTIAIIASKKISNYFKKKLNIPE